MPEKYIDRYQAGRILAKALTSYAKQSNTLILALPRGGVPVAFEVAQALQLPMDVFIVRKLGVPGHDELAMGAIAMGGARVFNENILQDLHIPQRAIDIEIEKEQQELQRRNQAYRGTKPFPTISNMTIILVDDGIATGASMRAAIKSLRMLEAKKIVVAVPVMEQHLATEFVKEVDELICPLKPAHFYAVGAWYDNFSQTEDEEVYTLLKTVNH